MAITCLVTFNMLHCASCGIPFCITPDYEDRRRADHKNFYCPSGHTNAYSAETEEERLRKNLHAANLAKERAERERSEERLAKELAQEAKAKAERVAKRAKKLTAAGVCPCCPRTFVNLQRHIAGKHPEYAAENGINLAKAIQPPKGTK